MESSDARYRLKLADGFLKEAEKQFTHKLFRAAVDAAQLSVENAIKAVIAIFKPVPKVHEMAGIIGEILKEIQFTDDEVERLKKLQQLAEIMGFETHIRTDYGDELQQVTPWELYDEDDALKALNFARESYIIASRIVKDRLQ